VLIQYRFISRCADSVPVSPTLAAAKTSNAGYCPSYLPVVVIFGGIPGSAKVITETLADMPRLGETAEKPQDCAEYLLFVLLNAEKGMHRRNAKGDDIGSWVSPGRGWARTCLGSFGAADGCMKPTLSLFFYKGIFNLSVDTFLIAFRRCFVFFI